MRWLIACDKFKRALSALEACQYIRAGLEHALPAIQHNDIDLCPLSDGGDGFLQVIAPVVGAEFVYSTCQHADGQLHQAPWLWDASRQTAYIEVAAAVGLASLPGRRRHAWSASSYGVGQLIQEALSKGARQIYVGIGGSSSHDLGLGLACALGINFFDEHGNSFLPTANKLGHLRHVAHRGVLPPGCKLTALYDVSNPLLGEKGAAMVYASQKGIAKEDLAELERLSRQAVERLSGQFAQANTLAYTAGSGAGGGLAFGMALLLGARLQSGIEWVAERLNLAQRIEQAQYVITGEGSFSPEEHLGKVTQYVGRLCRQKGKICIVLCGSSQALAKTSVQTDFDLVMPINRQLLKHEEALSQTGNNLYESAFWVGRFARAIQARQ